MSIAPNNIFDGLKQKSEFVYYLYANKQIINEQLISQIKEKMIAENKLQFRICLHESDDEKIQSMIIFYRKGFFLDFIWQDTGIVQYTHLEGKGEIICLNSLGQETKIISSNYNPIIKLKASQTRKIIPKSDFWIFSEVAEGPFKAENTKRLNYG
jgi:cupin fold WbuC family metalloprotein